MEPAGVSVVAYVIEPKTVAALSVLGVELNDAAVWLRDHELIHAVRYDKLDRGAALPLDVWLNLSGYLEQAIPYWDTVNQNLVYVFDLPEKAGKVAVHVNYSAKVRDGGKRKNIKSNFISTGGMVDTRNFSGSAYVRLEK